jgi:hypothetical protein
MTIKDWIIRQINATEEILTILAIRAAPWAAPFAPAYGVYRAVKRHLDAPWWAAGAIGAAIELIGIAAAHTALLCWEWNQEKNQSDPPAPFTLSVWLTIIYLISGSALSVLLEIWPEVIAPFAFAFAFALAADIYATIAIFRMVKAWQELKAEAKALREAEKAETFRTAKEAISARAAATAEVKNAESQLSELKAEQERLWREIAARQRELASLGLTQNKKPAQPNSPTLTGQKRKPGRSGSASRRGEETIKYLSSYYQKHGSKPTGSEVASAFGNEFTSARGRQLIRQYWPEVEADTGNGALK